MLETRLERLILGMMGIDLVGTSRTGLAITRELITAGEKFGVIEKDSEKICEAYI